MNSAGGPLLQLTTSGVSYLKDHWRITVNRNGKERKAKEMRKKHELESFENQKNWKDVQRLDQRIFNLLKGYYTQPQRYFIFMCSIRQLNTNLYPNTMFKPSSEKFDTTLSLFLFSLHFFS